MIGIGITTTSNRTETAKIAIENIIKYSDGCKIVIIQDVKGIARAKNDCIKQLEDCEWVILLDDDIWPTKQYWWLPYIESGEKHLCFTFSHYHNGAQNGNRLLEGQINGLPYYQNPCGCAMFIHRDCINKVGYFDDRYNGYAYEHVQYSERIHNAGLTTKPFMDIPDSTSIFHSMDYFMEIKSSVSYEDRMKYIRHNRPLYFSDKGTSKYIPYEDPIH